MFRRSSNKSFKIKLSLFKCPVYNIVYSASLPLFCVKSHDTINIRFCSVKVHGHNSLFACVVYMTCGSLIACVVYYNLWTPTLASCSPTQISNCCGFYVCGMHYSDFSKFLDIKKQKEKKLKRIF